MFWDVDPKRSLLACTGICMPHPKTYAGEADLERFKLFTKGLLQWLLVNLLLGPNAESTSAQLTYLGTRLIGDTLKWFSQNMEDYRRQTCNWTLESVLVGLWGGFLHSLMHRYASTCFDAACQGNSTVQDLLNRLTKYAAHMVVMPDEYTL